MPEGQLTDALGHAAEKGDVEELFAALEAAIQADVKAFLRQGNRPARRALEPPDGLFVVQGTDQVRVENTRRHRRTGPVGRWAVPSEVRCPGSSLPE